MSLDLPKTSKEMQDWKWDDYEPFFEHLLEQEINPANINSWMKYWSDFSELIGEVGTDVYVSTPADTTDEEAKKNYNEWLKKNHGVELNEDPRVIHYKPGYYKKNWIDLHLMLILDYQIKITLRNI